MESRKLHILPISSVVKTIKAMAPEIGMGTTSEVQSLECCFNEGCVPRTFEQAEIDKYLSNCVWYNKENNAEFMNFLKEVDTTKYDEVIFWFEEHANSLMLLSVICNIFADNRISMVMTKRLYDLAYYFSYAKAYANRELISEDTKQYLASLWDKERWHKKSLWVIENHRLQEVTDSEIREMLLKSCKTQTFTPCAGVIGLCMCHCKPSWLFSVNVYYPYIIDMIEEGILEAKQIVSKEKISELKDIDEHYYAPNGVDISATQLFSVRIKTSI